MLIVDPPNEHTPGGLTEAASTLSDYLSSRTLLPEPILIAVGWHTESQARFTRLPRHQPFIMWSHGVGSFVFYQSRPLLSLLRAALRVWDLLGMAHTLMNVSCLVVAYHRRSWLDTRSIDEAFARILSRNVRVIPNPINTSQWYPSSDQTDLSSSGPSFVLSVGRAEWQKGHTTVLKLSSKLVSSPRLHIIAPVVTDHCADIRALSRSLGINDRVFLDFGLSVEQRRTKYQQAACLICWSDTEYQSLAILEALACGCPVVARPRGWLRNRRIPGVLVARSNKQAIHYIDRICLDSNYRVSLGLAGRQYVVDNHSLPIVADLWIALEKELISNAYP